MEIVIGKIYAHSKLRFSGKVVGASTRPYTDEATGKTEEPYVELDVYIGRPHEYKTRFSARCTPEVFEAEWVLL